MKRDKYAVLLLYCQNTLSCHFVATLLAGLQFILLVIILPLVLYQTWFGEYAGAETN